jgi:hypothetical protein
VVEDLEVEDDGEDGVGLHRDEDGIPASRIYGSGDRRLPGCHGAGSNPRLEAEQRQRRATYGSSSSPELGSRRVSLYFPFCSGSFCKNDGLIISSPSGKKKFVRFYHVSFS